MDHTFLPNLFTVQGQDSFDHILRSPDLTTAAVTQWATNKTGFIANNVANNFGFARIPDDSSILKKIDDPAPGPHSPHFEFIPTNFYLNPGFATPPTGSFFTMVTVLLNPTSRKFLLILRILLYSQISQNFQVDLFNFDPLTHSTSPSLIPASSPQNSTSQSCASP